MSGTRLCQLLAEWAEEDRTMAELYESISLDDVKQILSELHPRPKNVESGSDDLDSDGTQR